VTDACKLPPRDEVAKVVHLDRARPRTFWSVVFECTREEVLSVKINDVGDSEEDKRRVVECLRNLADDIEWSLGCGPQT
jgi:hypothetical protein